MVSGSGRRSGPASRCSSGRASSPAWPSIGARTRVGFGLGLLVPLGLGFDVATRLGVGLGVGFGVGFGVGLGVAGGETVMLFGETLDSDTVLRPSPVPLVAEKL